MRATRLGGDLLDGILPGGDGLIHVLAACSHPDDESFYQGGTLLKLGKDPRVRLHVLCMTDGSADVAGARLGIGPAGLARLRRRELEEACALLGAGEPAWWGLPDGGLASLAPGELEERLLAEIEGCGAALLTAHDPFGISGHPDHRAASAACAAAFRRSGAQALYQVTLAPWRYGYNLLFALSRGGEERARPSHRVDISAELPLKRRALHCHASQRSFSFLNGLAMREDLLFHHEHFALAGRKEGGSPP